MLFFQGQRGGTGFMQSFLKGFILLPILWAACSCSVMHRQPTPSDHAGPAVYPGYVPRGTVEERIYPSSVPGASHRRMIVYLPEGYQDNTRRYPVVYLLHGARGYETSWIKKGLMLQLTDSLFAGGYAVPSIVVMPNMNQYDNDADYGDSRYKNALESFFEVNGVAETGFRHDVVDYVDAHFRTIPDKAHRAVAGLSIGGLQSAYLSANNPDTFGYVGLFSPVFRANSLPNPFRDFYRKFRKKLQVQFDEPPTRYLLMAGKKDIVRLPASMYHKFLGRKGYGHDFTLSPGGHSWSNWRNYYVEMMTKLFIEE